MRILAVLVVILSSPLALAEPRLAWLEGRWSGSQDGIEMEEIWTSPSGGALVGVHKDVRGGRMVGFEFFRIDAGPDGLVYHASPNAEPATPFRLLELGDRRVVFSNETHDFPQRIIYWLDATGALHARIEGKIGGKPRAKEWTWSKAPQK